jgi:hypothetical protein
MKHTVWGSRLTTSKERNLLKAIQQKNLKILSTGEPTYWPPDRNKTPDLLDFAITKGISEVHSHIESNFDLSSDHRPLIITISMNVLWKEPRPKLCTCITNWQLFQETINKNIRLNHRIKENQELEEAVHYLTKLIQEAAWQATPPHRKTVPKSQKIPLHIREFVADKRRARRK